MQLQLENSNSTRKPRPQRRKRDVFDDEDQPQPPQRNSSQEKYKQQIVNIDDGEQEAIGGMPCLINVGMLAAQKEAIEARNKTTLKNFVRNEMFYGEDTGEVQFNSIPNVNAPCIFEQPKPKSMGELIITPSKEGGRVMVFQGGKKENEEEDNQGKKEEKVEKTGSKVKRKKRQVFGSDSQPELPTQAGEEAPKDQGSNITKPQNQKIEQQEVINPQPEKPQPPKQPQQPQLPSSTSIGGNLYTIQIDSQVDLKQFYLRPLPKGTIMQCQIRRYTEGMHTRYQLFLDDLRPLMFAQPKASVGCNMHISMTRESDRKSKFYLGKLRSNMLGSMYSIYTAGENPKSTYAQKEWRSLIGNIEYESNFMGLKGPRRINVKLPASDAQFPENLYKVSDDQTLWNLEAKFPGCVKTFRNREPRWNERLKSYALNFGGRVKQASIKNFILVEFDPALERVGYVNTLIFGKISQMKFSLEFTHPFSPMQAYCIALSSFDSKLNCQ